MRELAFLNKNLTITAKDLRVGHEETFHYEGGLKAFVEYLDEGRTPLHTPVCFVGERAGVGVEVALQYNDSYSENIYSFVNNVYTMEGGTHETGFKTALTHTLNGYGAKYNMFKNASFNLSGEGRA